MAAEGDGGSINSDTIAPTVGFRYMIVRPEKAGIRDLFRFMVSPNRATGAKFIETSDDLAPAEDAHDFSGGGGDGHRGGGGGGGGMSADHRWVIFVSIIVRKIIAVLGKPMEWTGYFVEFLLNLFSLNGNLLHLLSNFLHGKVVMPQRGSETFISAIGHLDHRIDLDKNDLFLKENGETGSGDRGIQVEIENRALMDLCMMASKLAYENASVVRNVVNQHWKMHFVDFYNCWNDYQKERSTQVFILCDKPKDANLILVSFRGTEPFDADDWSTDFDYSWYEIPKLGKVHMGFLEALGLGNRADTSTFHKLLQVKNTESTFSNGVDPIAGPLEESESISSYNDYGENRGVSDESSDSEGLTSNGAKKKTKKVVLEMAEMTAYFTVRSKLKSLLKDHKNAKFMVTGHSLGGALAILFPTVLVLHEEEEVMKRLLGVHTFGQPRIGNMQVGRYMETHLVRPVPKYFRVVYCNDLVPRLPYDDKAFLYKHFGVCLYYNSLYIEQKVDEEPNRNYFGLLYVIPDYMNAGWELIRSFMLGYIHGPDYKEGWLSIMLRMVGLVIPGLSAHSPTDYVNSVRLGRMREEVFIYTSCS